MKILLIGANGQLGSDLRDIVANSPHSVIPLTHSEIEVTQPQSIQAILTFHQPNVIINTAAYHKVDEVEQNPEKAFAVNAIAPWHLALACRQQDIPLLFISTDYVFGGDHLRHTPYTEQDLPAPLNIYGASKLAGEALVRTAWEKHYVVRTSGLYGVRGASGKGGNFVEFMLRLANEGKDIKVVTDQRLTPTYTMDLAKKLLALIESEKYGLYHVTK